MSRRFLLFGAVVIFLLGHVGASAQAAYTAKEDEEIYGTWTNEKVSGDSVHPQKIVVTPDAFRMFRKISSKLPPDVVQLWIVDKWTDSDGNIWYKVNAAGTGGASGYKFQQLYKLSDNGNVMESANVTLSFGVDFDPSRYPTAIDPSDYLGYSILYKAAD